MVSAAAFEVEISVPASAHTLDGFRRWAVSGEFPEQGRFTLYAGEVFVDLSPERVGAHNQVKEEIRFLYLRYVAGRVAITLACGDMMCSQPVNGVTGRLEHRVIQTHRR